MKKENISIIIGVSSIVALLSILFSFMAPLVFTDCVLIKGIEPTNIGDTIGGLMSPFIGISGFIITGLAFYMQFEANRQQREQFKESQQESKEQFQQQIDSQNKQNAIQIFESQFYEMLKIYRANVAEMKIMGYDFDENGLKFDKITEGRKIFVTMQTELHCILEINKKLNSNKGLNEADFKECYDIFFFGLDNYKESNNKDNLFVTQLYAARKKHEAREKKNRTTERKKFKINGVNDEIKLYFNYKPFSGHSLRLGHYYRHLYLTVKTVVNSDIITKDDKKRYLRLLRAQMSNYEQLHLFYNWLSGYGADWEKEGKNRFFTKHYMIHNIWHHNIYEDKYMRREIVALNDKKRKGIFENEIPDNFY